MHALEVIIARNKAAQAEYDAAQEQPPYVHDVPGCPNSLSCDERCGPVEEPGDEYDPTPWCNGCGARTSRDCVCGPLAEND